MTWAMTLESRVAINIIFPHVHGQGSHLKFMVVKCFLFFFQDYIFIFNLHGVDLGGWIIFFPNVQDDYNYLAITKYYDGSV